MRIIKQTRDTLSETYKDALAIRYAVFVREQGVPYTLEVASAIDEAAAVHFVLYDNAVAAGTVRLLTREDVSLVQRMAVSADKRGQGIADELLSAVIDFARADNIPTLTLHAQLTALGLYERFGFAPFGNVFVEAGIQHIEMKKKIS
ncbi:MAG: GNAT family N-acetyltransferase [Streptococcaceae bacterium]|jgi:predicted GNAT family N-acyltransferase|nr:GNAT family N-acetyltransferase [Streptococcaceae bacterium]